MSAARRPVLPLIVFIVIAALSVLASAISWPDQGPVPLTTLVYAGVGAVIARRTGNRIGWLLQLVAVSALAESLSEAYLYRSSIAAAPLPGAAWAALTNQVADSVAAAAIILMILVYPTARLPSRRWRVALWVLLASAACSILGLVFRAGSMDTNNPTSLTNPIGIGPRSITEAIVWIGSWGLLASGIASIVAVTVRSRRATGDEREQIRWLAYVGIVGVGLLLLSGLTVAIVPASKLNGVAAGIAAAILWGGFLLCFVIGIPAAVGLAILKHHLYDIDVVIRRTVVYAALAVFITAVYVAIVVGIGALVNSEGKPNLGLSILATAVVALAFQPVRERVQRFANRLVYGKRATPYEALSALSDRMSSTYATEDLLPRMAKVLAEATGASRADVWLRDGDELHAAASWPADASSCETTAIRDGDLPTIAGADRVVAVLHDEGLLGALSIAKKRGEAVTPLEDKLIADLAAQAGPVLRNVGLTDQLVARLEDIRASRHRLVTARDDERRRVERRIHEGAERNLAEVSAALDHVSAALDRDEAAARELLQGVQTTATTALESLREVARGIYPPLLADKGLTAALEGQARKSPLPIGVESDGVARYAQEVESTVYFCAVQALQNVARYADASSARIRLSASNRDLSFEVADNGGGFDPATTGFGPSLQAMSDRLEALDGTLVVHTQLGAGTTITGRLPARALESAP
ncbi:MAG TPA: ATP-binding protein [Actinomycetota bacterium]|nr:ATP-binding protein [Actinomycetota bacterium]